MNVHRRIIRRCAGFGLAELVLALSLGSMITLGGVQLAQSVAQAFQLQRAQSQLLEEARFARSSLATVIAHAGYHPAPWQSNRPAISPNSTDSLNDRSDRLAASQWSTTNCFENANPMVDSGGQPLFYLKVTSFFATEEGNLVLTCDYGPDSGSLVRQINQLGLVENVEQFKVHYAEDFNADGNADRWVKAGQWQRERQLRGVRLALLLASPNPSGIIVARTFTVLDQTITMPADGRLRQSFTFTFAIRSRT